MNSVIFMTNLEAITQIIKYKCHTVKAGAIWAFSFFFLSFFISYFMEEYSTTKTARGPGLLNHISRTSGGI